MNDHTIVQGCQTFPVKDAVQNISVLVGCTVSFSVTQLCHCSSKAAMDRVEEVEKVSVAGTGLKGMVFDR